MDWKPVNLTTTRGEPCIVNAAAVVMLTQIGAKSSPQCQILLNSGHNVVFAGSLAENAQAISAAMAGQPQPKPSSNLPPDLKQS